MKPTLDEVEDAAKTVYTSILPTPECCWPLLSASLGTEVWVKHENHTPIGSFKIRGGLTYFERLAKLPDRPRGVISATRGNHGQSIGWACRRHGLAAAVVAPHGNSREKNSAMRALGVDVIEFGDDFQAAREHAEMLADQRSLHFVPSFDPLLVRGAATYSLELFRRVQGIDVAYVPIGLGSGICGMVAVRDALRLRTQIVGVVSAHAPAYSLSFAAGRPVENAVTTKLGDGMACRTPEPDALEIIWQGVERIVEVTDDELGAAMRLVFECTHNVCEGAAAAPVAAARKERTLLRGRRVAVVLSGANVDREIFASVLCGDRNPETPSRIAG